MITIIAFCVGLGVLVMLASAVGQTLPVITVGLFRAIGVLLAATIYICVFIGLLWLFIHLVIFLI